MKPDFWRFLRRTISYAEDIDFSISLKEDRKRLCRYQTKTYTNNELISTKTNKTTQKTIVLQCKDKCYSHNNQLHQNTYTEAEADI